MRALLRFLEVVERAAHDDLAAVVEEEPEQVLERQDARLPVHDRERVDPERGLQRGRREELVQDHLRDGVALDVDDHPHALPVGLVSDRRDALDPLVVDEARDLLDEARLVDLERELRDDDRLAVALLRLLDLRAPAHLQDAAARLVGVHDALPAEDDSARGKVRARHRLDEPGELGLRVVQEDDRGGAGLGEVVWCDLRRHADGDAFGAVHEEVRELQGQDGRLLERAVVVQRPVDGLLVDVVAEHLFGEAREPDLGVAHRRRRVPVHRAEVALSVHERLGHGEVLSHPDDRVVDRGVAVRVVLAHDVADESGRLLVGAVVAIGLLPHPEEHAAVDGLEAVAHVGQRAPDDDGHRVIEIAPPDLLLDRDGNLLRGVDGRRLFGGVGQPGSLKYPDSTRSARSSR